MTDNLKHLDLDSDEFEDAPRGLRDYARKLKKAYEESQDSVSKLTGQLHSRVVGEVLTDKGFKNPKRVEKDLLADGVDPLDKAAVDGWLAEYGDDYAKAEAEPASTPVQNEQPPPQGAADLQQIQQVANQATPEEALSNWQKALAEITPQMDGAAVLQVYQKYGV